MPKGSILGITSNRNAHDANSLFLDVKYGELIRADFAESSCTPEILAQVKKRSGQSDEPQADKAALKEEPEQHEHVVPPAPVVQEIALSADVLFDFDKSIIKPEGKTALEQLITQLKGKTFELIAVTGHTDWIGTEEYNQKLSVRRALAVRDYLLARGIDAKRIFAQGKGKTQPVADNRTTQGRAKNRRVMVELVARPTVVNPPIK
jgi:outer membrane protein OmpA-like peptidoglycan-associated protein